MRNSGDLEKGSRVERASMRPPSLGLKAKRRKGPPPGSWSLEEDWG